MQELFVYYLMWFLTRRDNLSSYSSPGNVCLNIIFKIPGQRVTEAWVFLYIKNKFLPFHRNRHKTTDGDLLPLDKRRNQRTHAGMCQGREKERKKKVLFLNWHIGQWCLLWWGISHVWFRLFKNSKYRNVSKRDVYRIHVTPYIFNNLLDFCRKWVQCLHLT